MTGLSSAATHLTQMLAPTINATSRSGVSPVSFVTTAYIVGAVVQIILAMILLLAAGNIAELIMPMETPKGFEVGQYER